jgi:glutathione S-transferase
MRKIRGGFADMARIVEDKPYVVGERLGLGDIGFGCVLALQLRFPRVMPTFRQG